MARKGRGQVRVAAGVAAILAISGALLALDADATSTARQERPPVEVLGAVEIPTAVPAVGVAVADLAEPAPVSTTTVAAPTSAPTTTAPTTTAPVTTTSPAPTTTVAAPTPTDRGLQAIAQIPYPWQARFPAWRIEVAGARSGVRALTHPDRQLVELFVRSDDTVEELGRVLAHELGHVADLELNDDADRQRWREVRGVGSGVPWWPNGTSFDFDTLAGDFAEAFATWLVGSTSQSRVGGPLTPDQLAVVGQLAG